MSDPEFGRRFIALLREAGAPVAQQKLGRWLGVSGAMAWNYKNGEKLPAMGMAIFMAHKLNCCVEYLLTGEGPKRPAAVIPSDFDRLTPTQQQVVRMVIAALLEPR